MDDLNDQLDDAINEADIEKVKTLLDKGADLESEDAFGNTPLMNAAWVASKELVEYLLAMGANKLHQNKDGQTALELVKTVGHNEYGHEMVIEVLRR